MAAVAALDFMADIALFGSFSINISTDNILSEGFEFHLRIFLFLKYAKGLVSEVSKLG